MKNTLDHHFAKQKNWDVVYTDGACKPNPGRGGWGFCVWPHGTNIEFASCGGEINTTNNRMEMRAILEFLKFAVPGRNYIIHTDSKYCLESLVKSSGDILEYPGEYGGYIKGWLRVNFKDKQNPDLWKKIDKRIRILTGSESKLQFVWVKGHSNIPGNERADELANEGYKIAG